MALEVDISQKFDGIFVGYIISTILSGITVLQAWNYAQRNKDGWKLRFLVTLLFVMDAALLVLDTISIHSYLVDHFGDYMDLLNVNEAFLTEVMINTASICIVQLFFATRVYFLHPGSTWISGLISTSSILSLGSGIYSMTFQFQHSAISDIARRQSMIPTILSFALTVLSDGITTAALSVDLIRAKSYTHFESPTNLFHDLLMSIATRGFLATLSSIVFLIMYIANPTCLYWVPLHMTLSKTYTITLFAILNARPSCTGQQRAGETGLSDLDFARVPENSSRASAVTATYHLDLHENDKPIEEPNGNTDSTQQIRISG